jgi:hypothetical protein
MGHSRWIPLLLLSLTSIFAAPLAAQEQGGDRGWSGLEDPISPDRPDFTNGTVTLPRGHVQVEGGATRSRAGDDKETDLGELEVRIGMGERWELELSPGSHVRVDSPGGDVSGYEDPGVGIKLRLTGEMENRPRWRPAVAVLLGTSLPVGSHDLTADVWVPGATLAFDWDLTPVFSLSANVGGSRESDGAERFDQLSASLSAGFGLTDRLGGYFEVYALSQEEPGGSSTRYVDTGLSYLVLHDLSVDARIGYGLDGDHPNGYAGVGAAVRF